jgi:hypothetical protein
MLGKSGMPEIHPTSPFARVLAEVALGASRPVPAANATAACICSAVDTLATAEFNTIRLRLLKLGAQVVEMASRVRLAFAAACPEAALIRHIAAALMPTGP